MPHKKHLEEAIALNKKLVNDESLSDFVDGSIGLIKETFAKGNKVLIAGNGGSAADAQHFAAEFVGRYKKERKAYPVIALTTDTSAITAWSNDYSFDTLFARKIEALGKPGDVFIGLSTSGNSKNIIEGVKRANDMGLVTMSLLGKGGGALQGVAHFSYVVPSDNTPRIQETHMTILHIICEEVEKTFTTFI